MFDQYSDTSDFDTMWDGQSPDPTYTATLPPIPPGHKMKQGQKPKFEEEMTGYCPDANQTPCDLFLWSWTLTVSGACTPVRTPNSRMGQYLRDEGHNAYGRIINILYCDYVQYARGCDIALYRNGCAGEYTSTGTRTLAAG